jgi:hypothetical protein
VFQASTKSSEGATYLNTTMDSYYKAGDTEAAMTALDGVKPF